MTDKQWIVLLVIIAIVYFYLLKKNDRKQNFKNWLDRHPQQKSKLGQELCDEIFVRPGEDGGDEAFDYCWKMAENGTPIPDNLLEGNKLLIPIIREYLREQRGVVVQSNLTLSKVTRN